MSINLCGHQIHYFLSDLCCTNMISWVVSGCCAHWPCLHLVLQRTLWPHLRERVGIRVQHPSKDKCS